MELETGQAQNSGVSVKQHTRRNERRNHRTGLPNFAKVSPQVQYKLPYYEILSSQEIELIDDQSCAILEEIGIDFRDEEALALWKRAGAAVDGQRVRIPRGLLREKMRLAPAAFVHHARNPDRSVTIGGRYMVFGPVYGPPYVRDFDGTRRNSTLQDLVNFIKLTYATPVLNYSGGLIVEPMDIAVPKRHLDVLYSHIKYSDKPFMGSVTSRERALDSVRMAEIVFGEAFVRENVVLIGLCSGNSPLVWDNTMLDAMRVYAECGQAVIVAPFIMQGANSPVTTAGSLVQLNAEALAGIAFCQLVRAGTPVVYGNSLATVSMQTGSPQYGTTETSWLILAIAQLARHYKVPYRTGGNRNTSKAHDPQCGYESIHTLFPTFAAGTNVVIHAAGWLESALSASYAKFIMDLDNVAVLQRFVSGIDFGPEGLAIDAIREVGPAGHYFGCQHTLRHYEDAFYIPMSVDRTARWEQWVEEGSDMTARATAIARQMLDQYQPPPLDETMDRTLLGFIEQRKRELPDSVT